MSVALEGREAKAGKKRGLVKLAGEGMVVDGDGEMVDGLGEQVDGLEKQVEAGGGKRERL